MERINKLTSAHLQADSCHLLHVLPAHWNADVMTSQGWPQRLLVSQTESTRHAACLCPLSPRV